MQLLTKPLLVSAIGTGLWFLARRLGYLAVLSENDEAAMTATITTLGLIYWLVAASALATAWSEWTQTQDAALSGNRKRFWQLVDRRMPAPLKSAFLVISSLTWLSFMFMPFNALPAGLFSIFSVSLVISIVWEVVSDLDSPLDGIWNVKNPPPRE